MKQLLSTINQSFSDCFSVLHLYFTLESSFGHEETPSTTILISVMEMDSHGIAMQSGS